jgi:hypothetical protein
MHTHLIIVHTPRERARVPCATTRHPEKTGSPTGQTHQDPILPRDLLPLIKLDHTPTTTLLTHTRLAEHTHAAQPEVRVLGAAASDLRMARAGTLEGRGTFDFRELAKKSVQRAEPRIQSSTNAFLTALFKVRLRSTAVWLARPASKNSVLLLAFKDNTGAWHVLGYKAREPSACGSGLALQNPDTGNLARPDGGRLNLR